MKVVGSLILGLGSFVVSLTKMIHEGLYQLAAKGGFTDVTNPLDDVDDPGDPLLPVQISWWVGGTTILVTLATIFICGLSGKKGGFKKGGYKKDFKGGSGKGGFKKDFKKGGYKKDYKKSEGASDGGFNTGFNDGGFPDGETRADGFRPKQGGFKKGGFKKGGAGKGGFKKKGGAGGFSKPGKRKY